MTGLPVLLYDGDCGFCTRSVRWVDGFGARTRVLPWQEADLSTYRTTAARARHEVLWVAESGRVFGGSAAVTQLLRHAHGPWRVVGCFLSLPVVRVFAEWGYRWVANNRHRLPGATPACQLPPEQRPGGGLDQ